jgi:hypothetical protein
MASYLLASSLLYLAAPCFKLAQKQARRQDLTKDSFLDPKKISETWICFIRCFFNRLKQISYESIFGGVMGSGVRHFGLYAVFGAKYQ